MTVCTYYVAILNFSQYLLPIAIPDAVGDAEALLPNMIELENHYISLAAVGAGVIPKILNNEFHSLIQHGATTRSGIIDVLLTISGVMLSMIGGPTWAAVIVALAFMDSPPSEILHWLIQVTTTAGSQLHP